MRVVIIGGTGRTGRLIAERAHRAGHAVCAFGRSASDATVPSGVTPIQGDATDPDALRAAVAAADAVVVALSIPRASASPFAAVTGPTDLHSRSMGYLLDAMASEGVTRLIKLSAQGVGDSAPRTGIGFRVLVAVSNLRPAFRDHAIADALVEGSNTDFTVVRPPRLVDVAAGGRVVAGEDVTTSTWTALSRLHVADFVIQALDTAEWSGRTVSLAPA